MNEGVIMSISIKLAHSPDADDAFMFYGLAMGKISTEDIQYEHVLKDIQTLNEWALTGKMEITAISAHAYAYVHDKYSILIHGGSIGKNYGPIVVSKKAISLDDFKDKLIAVPGKMTSAYLALRLCIKQFSEKIVPFDQILETVAAGEADAGLLIHEGQLTYLQQGFKKIIDLGEWWFNMTRLPLPMGLNAIRKDLPQPLQKKISTHLKNSIQYSLDHRQEALDYALKFGRGLSRPIADQFVGMWVNERTLDMGEEGKKSIIEFLKQASTHALIPEFPAVDFVN